MDINLTEQQTVPSEYQMKTSIRELREIVEQKPQIPRPNVRYLQRRHTTNNKN